MSSETGEGHMTVIVSADDLRNLDAPPAAEHLHVGDLLKQCAGPVLTVVSREWRQSSMGDWHLLVLASEWPGRYK